MTLFKSDNAELHLNILTQKMTRIKQQMHACNAKLEMDASKIEGGIDKEAEAKKFLELDAEYKILEKNLTNYEDQVLDLTRLPKKHEEPNVGTQS